MPVNADMGQILRAFFVLLYLPSCAPFSHGPVYTHEKAQNTFGPLITFMGVQPGMAIADVGAGSGAHTVAMSTLLVDCKVYIQDIDSSVLRAKNIEKMIRHYSEDLGNDLHKQNDYFIIYGNTTSSKLPERGIDILYSNATLHVFESPDAMFQNLKEKLRPSGIIYIRDGFREEGAPKAFCSDKKCAKRLWTKTELIEAMKRNGFQLVNQLEDLSGYPVYGFEVANAFR